MRQILNTRDGSYDVLKVTEVPDLTPSDNELIIDVKASGINFADILARKGQYQDAPPKPCVMGYEISGVVSAVGAGADQNWLGKEVFGMCRFKGQAEQVAVHEKLIYLKPERLSFEEAATLPVNYLTAWALMVAMGGLSGDESILIHNAGGGVGLAQIEIANHIGATSYGTASAHKHDFLKQRGLDHPIDYRNKDWFEELMALTDNRGVDLITDPLGGKEWKRSYNALRATGRLGMFGVSTASTSSKGGLRAKINLIKALISMPVFHPLPLIVKNRGVFGVNLGKLWKEQEKGRRWMEQILKGVDDGWINPYVDKVFSFDEAGDAHRYIEERKNIGKVVLVP